ncbi:MAG TPA: hypothetical protein VMP10_03355 [Chloroflexota bacterium]|nr:hypothetical protein [Chloroflexota bacterium]
MIAVALYRRSWCHFLDHDATFQPMVAKIQIQMRQWIDFSAQSENSPGLKDSVTNPVGGRHASVEIHVATRDQMANLHIAPR